MTFCILLEHTILKVSLGDAQKYIVCLYDGPLFAPLLEFFFMTKPGIEVKWAVVLLGDCSTSRGLPSFFCNCNNLSRFPRKYCNQDIHVYLFMLMFFDHVDQLLDLILSPYILLFHCWKRYAWDSVVHNVAAGFTGAFRIVLWSGRSSTTRGNLGMELSFVMKLILCFQAYRFLNELCKQCVIEDDRMYTCLVKSQSSLLSELKVAPNTVLGWH